jgi:two-component system, chemotaxis family, chemotaxis protein CheY
VTTDSSQDSRIAQAVEVVAVELGRHVLVVDDDEDAREALADILRLNRFSVSTAENGRLGLAALDAGQRPDVIVLDLEMPVMNGWDFLTAIRARPELGTALVVVVSGNRDSARDLGGAPFFPKPLDIDQLLVFLERRCARPVADART